MIVKKLTANFFMVLSFILLLGVNNALAGDDDGIGGGINEGDNNNSITNEEEQDNAVKESQAEDSNQVPEYPWEGNVYKDTGNSNDLVNKYNPYSWEGAPQKSYDPNDKIEKVTREKDGVVVTEGYIIKNDKVGSVKKVGSEEDIKSSPEHKSSKKSSNYLSELIDIAKEKGRSHDSSRSLNSNSKYFPKQTDDEVIIDFNKIPSQFKVVYVHGGKRQTLINTLRPSKVKDQSFSVKISEIKIKGKEIHIYSKIKEPPTQVPVPSKLPPVGPVPSTSPPTQVPVPSKSPKVGPSPSTSPPVGPGPSTSPPTQVPPFSSKLPPVGLGPSILGNVNNSAIVNRNKHKKFVHHHNNNEWTTIPLDTSEEVLLGE